MELTRRPKMTELEKASQRGGVKQSKKEKKGSADLFSKLDLWRQLIEGGPEERARFVESHLSKNLAFQLRAMREKEEWSQIDLGHAVDMNQNAISRLENPFYGKATLTTLKRIAA